MAPYPADAAVRRAQADHAVGGRGRDDRAARFRADRKRHAAGGGRRARTGRRSARPALRIPRAVGAPAEPAIALRKRAERELGHEHCAGVAQPLDDRRVVVEYLLDVRLAAPARDDALRREQILGSPWQPMQRSAIFAGLDLAVGVGRLLDRQIFRERDVEVERRLIALEPIEVHPRQLAGRHETALDQGGQLRDRPERDLLEVCGPFSVSGAFV